MSENGEIYTAGKNFTLPLAVTAWTNSTSGQQLKRGATPISDGIFIAKIEFWGLFMLKVTAKR